jgi:hypothetical protein
MNVAGRRWPRRVGRILGTVGLAGFLTAGGIAWLSTSEHGVAVDARHAFESAVNTYLDEARRRGAGEGLTRVDAIVLHAGVAIGSLAGRAISPEGSRILWHAVHGDGTELALDPAYFRRSELVAGLIERLGPGRHGPIGVHPHEDWRVALALNPIYLDVTDDRVRIGHPRIRFASVDDPGAVTLVPIGRIRLEVPDGLVDALGQTPFAAWAEWRREPAAGAP